ncbi:MAG: hypothetical protein MHM6MM_002344 [Cercozoa sp. M6MM]
MDYVIVLTRDFRAGPKSSRQRLKTKHVVAKKAKEHKRKVNKAMRVAKAADPEAFKVARRRKMRQAAHIPNSFPGKAQMLKAMKSLQQGQLTEEEKRLEERRRRREQAKQLRLLDSEQAEREYLDRRAMEVDPTATADDDVSGKELQQISSPHIFRQYREELNNVIKLSDVVVVVLDARDPEGTRCREVETRIHSQFSERTGREKRLVFVLNKVDLVPPDVVERWVTYLQRVAPVIAFKSNTQKQKSGKASMGHRATLTAQLDAAGLTKGAVGTAQLLELLKKYSLRGQDIKTAITVGLVGYPNVGKSSVINSLKRCRAVGTSSTPGFTKTVQEVHLDKQLKLLDSPGVIFSNGEQNDPDLVLRNCVRPEDLRDSERAAEAVMRKCPIQALMQVYEIPQFTTAKEFLYLVAMKRGKLKKGNVADMDAGARIILQDWNCGRIPYYTQPPVVHDEAASSAVVHQLGARFSTSSMKSSSDIAEQRTSAMQED